MEWLSKQHKIETKEDNKNTNQHNLPLYITIGFVVISGIIQSIYIVKRKTVRNK